MLFVSTFATEPVTVRMLSLEPEVALPVVPLVLPYDEPAAAPAAPPLA
jgi:hypothetical protein